MVNEMFERAIQFLKDHNEIALATCEGNLPKLRIFQIMKQEGHVLYFATSAKKAVWRELRQNPNVEILAYADNISVRCSGMVNFNVEEDVKRWIFDNNAVLSRLYASYDQMEYFCLPIAEMDYYDLAPTPPVFQHFDLIAGQVCQGFILHKLWVAEVPDRMDDRHLQFYRELMGSLCLTMMYDIFEAHAQQESKDSHSDRAAYIVKQLMAMLATGISQTEREVRYYAKRLNVSPKYLSETVRRKPT